MSTAVAISVQNLSKSFQLPHERQTSIKSVIVNLGRNKRGFERQMVLNDISFEVAEGEFFGIVGRNGSGKSTLLKLLAGIYSPNSGSIMINGKLTPFIELGVGFNPELSGRENVFLNGALLGFSRSEMLAMYNDIVTFAELERFMDQKLKNYSSGMQVRLAFSIAIRVKGGILLLDEVLAVGDAIFQKKCYDYFKQLKKEKRTVVFVSHDTGALQEYCTSGILIEKGQIIKRGSIDGIVHEYLDIINNVEQNSAPTPEAQKQWGTGQVTVETITMSKENKGSRTYRENEDIEFTVTFKAQKSTQQPVYGITIADLAGQIVFQSNTLWCRVEVADLSKNEQQTVHWKIPNTFNSGSYVVMPAASDRTGTIVYDWKDDMARFEVAKQQKSHGVINFEHTLEMI